MQKTLLALFLMFQAGSLFAQDETDSSEFTIIKELPTTICKSQDRTGTCWSFATTSFIETELIRKTGVEYDLSEMFFVRYNYISKGLRYVRFDGTIGLTEGSLAHDVMNIVREYGFVPNDAYPGKEYGMSKHLHGELFAIIEGFLNGVLQKKNVKLTPVWAQALAAVIDTYLGDLPELVRVNDKEYSPKEFAADIDPDDYVEITSYTHHPYYKSVVLETKDNWSHAQYFNLPLDEMLELMTNSINEGYSIVWDGDVVNNYFDHSEGKAVYKKGEDGIEEEITKEIRQKAYDNFSSIDEHLMHIIGMSQDTAGNIYYITKNSWGTEGNDFDGKVHMSQEFCKLYTTSIMVHKDAIPKGIRKKLGL